RCIADYEDCTKYFSDRASIHRILCALVFATCVAKSLIPFAGKGDKPESSKG
ncbi:hypothetical protein M2437_005475, partial [Methylorubrum pseudosasae]|nr:hypothetical protein [Methylorubrum pseudosasae]